MPDYSEAELNAAIAAERQRCIGILEEELERGRGLLALHDKNVKSIFNQKTMISCMEAIEYCAERLRDVNDPTAVGVPVAPSGLRWRTEMTELVERLDGYLNSPEQIQLRDELLAMLRALEKTD